MASEVYFRLPRSRMLKSNEIEVRNISYTAVRSQKIILSGLLSKFSLKAKCRNER